MVKSQYGNKILDGFLLILLSYFVYLGFLTLLYAIYLVTVFVQHWPSASQLTRCILFSFAYL